MNDLGRGNKAIVKNENKEVLDKVKQIVNADNKNTQVASAGSTEASKPVGNPKKIWQEALEKGVSDPHLIVGVVDVLTRSKKHDHAVEFLKANLRQGVVVRPWVYEALALSLEMSKGSLTDIERARVSTVDLEPQDAQGYLRASKAMAEHKLFDRALAYCRQAALPEPGIADPYQDALAYAGEGKDVASMEWAARNILRRLADGQPGPALRRRISSRSCWPDCKGRSPRRRRTPCQERAASTARDLIIKLQWQGCRPRSRGEGAGRHALLVLQRQSPGGGVLLGDRIGEARSNRT